LLQCGHNICGVCLSKSKHICCGICFFPVDVPAKEEDLFAKFFLDFFLAGEMYYLNGLRTYKEERGHKPILTNLLNDIKLSMNICSECEDQPAEGTCTNCEQKYCKGCFDRIHNMSKILKTHDLVPLSLRPSQTICEIHNLSVTSYCKQCKVYLCSDCILMHQLHDISKISSIEVSLT